MSLIRLGFLWVAVWLSYVEVAAAQPMAEVVVVPYGTPDLDDSLSVTSALEGALSDARVSLIPLHDARDRFTARSRPPQMASASDVDLLARAAQDAVEHVAFGRTAAAQRSVREVIGRAERTLESLNRETTTARHILDACLSLVRSALQAGKRDLALEQATRCRRLVPDLMPSKDQNPANVIGVLMEADNLLRRMRIGQLAVTSAPESGCSVYVNGRHLGTTPFSLERAAAGDYRVQVECNRALARVHLVQLGDQPVGLLVDTQFDRAISSDPRLLLQYPSYHDAREQAVPHAVQLGREIGATDVILVNAHDGVAEFLRVHVKQQRMVARAVVRWTDRQRLPRTEIEQAITVLAEARLEGEPSLKQNDEDVPETTSRTPAVAPERAVVLDAPAPQGSERVALPAGFSAKPSKGSTWQLWTGGAVAIAGIAGMVAGAFSLRERFAKGQRLAALYESIALRREWDDDRRFPRVASGISSAVLTTGVIIGGIKLDLKRHYWLPVATAVLGTATLAIGATIYAGNDACGTASYASPHCISGEHATDRGYQVLIAAVPLLSFSAAQLIRWTLPRAQLRAAVASRQLALIATF